jgi:phospholipase C
MTGVPRQHDACFSRRRFLLGAAGIALTASGGAAALARIAGAASPPLPSPASSGLDHIVVVMMENRSFDHYLGWLPGADGRQAGLTYPDRNNAPRSTYHLTQFASCANTDPDHSYEGARAEFNGGRCDGWLRAGANDELAIGYYQRPDLPFLGEAAVAWTACDHYFAPILGPTYPNRIYQHAGVTDRILNSTTTSSLPTIWDSLATAGLTGTYYFSDIPFLAIWGSKYVPIAKPYSRFLTDCATGSLPSVAFVDPRFGGEDQGISNDDHPRADIRAGEHFLSEIYNAVTAGPAWSKTLLVINYDEWGGFFDHVVPERAPDVEPSFERRGFRVPALLISPFARRGKVDHGVYDHTSVLKLIEWRFGLPPLSVRDANAANLATALDFSHPNASVPALTAPPVVPVPCVPAPPVGESEWAELATLAAGYGFSV